MNTAAAPLLIVCKEAPWRTWFGGALQYFQAWRATYKGRVYLYYYMRRETSDGEGTGPRGARVCRWHFSVLLGQQSTTSALGVVLSPERGCNAVQQLADQQVYSSTPGLQDNDGIPHLVCSRDSQPSYCGRNHRTFLITVLLWFSSGQFACSFINTHFNYKCAVREVPP